MKDLDNVLCYGMFMLVFYYVRNMPIIYHFEKFTDFSFTTMNLNNVTTFYFQQVGQWLLTPLFHFLQDNSYLCLCEGTGQQAQNR